MSQKSEARHELERLFPAAFLAGLNYDTRKSAIVFEDVLQAIKPLGSGALDVCDEACKVKDCFQLFCSLKKSAEWTLERTEAKTYVIVFDKYRFVPEIKGHEQNARNQKTPVQSRKKAKEKKPEPDRTPVDGIPFKKRRPYLSAGKPIPRDIRLALDDRDDTLQDIIRCLSVAWVSPNSGARFDFPHDKRIILVGHGLTLADCEHMMIHKGKADPQTDHDAYCTPLMVAYYENGQIGLSWLSDLRNELGETDMFLFYAIRKMRPHAVDILSVDTDMLALALTYLDKHHSSDVTKIYWRYYPALTWVYTFDGPHVNMERWVDVNALYVMMRGGKFNRYPPPKKNQSKKLKEEKEKALLLMSDADHERKKKEDDANESNYAKLQHPVLTLIMCFLVAKTDYTFQCLYGVTHEKYMEAMRRYSSYIGDLVEVREEKIFLRGDSFLRLLKTAFMIARGRFKDPHSGEMIHPATLTMEDVRARTDDLNPKNRFPSDAQVLLSAKQIAAVLLIYSQIGTASKLLEPDPVAHGYGPRDSSKPISRNNILRLKIQSTDDDED